MPTTFINTFNFTIFSSQYLFRVVIEVVLFDTGCIFIIEIRDVKLNFMHAIFDFVNVIFDHVKFGW